jgi:hypothetical protein
MEALGRTLVGCAIPVGVAPVLGLGRVDQDRDLKEAESK